MSEIKKGDRVKVVRTGGFLDRRLGQLGTVTYTGKDLVSVTFDEGGSGCGLLTDVVLRWNEPKKPLRVLPTGLSVPDLTLSAPSEGRMELLHKPGGEYFPFPHSALSALHTLLGEALKVWPVEVSE